MTVPQASESSAVALGFFDGVHIAHAEVIRRITGNSDGAVSTVLTFRSEGKGFWRKAGVKHILTEQQKLERFSALGVEKVVMPEFCRISELSPIDFFQEILVKRLHAVKLSCGFDYTFGKNASGNADMLRRLCIQAGISLEVVPSMELDGIPVSSTRIRELLLKGEIPDANRLLGYCYYITGEVVHGRSLGRTLGFPTLNQILREDQVIPKFGVYNSTAEIGGQHYKSITNIGVKPTIQGERAPLAETYLLDASGDFYGKTARVELLRMTRPEQRFDTLDELRMAVHRDIANRGRS